MAKSRPSDAAIASFCWQNDTAHVARIFTIAQKKLDELRRDSVGVSPFPWSETSLGTFNEASWRDWIESIQVGDAGHVDALRRLVATCRIRLGQFADQTPPEPTTAAKQGGDVTEGNGLGPGEGAGVSPIAETESISRVPGKPFWRFGSSLRSMREERRLTQDEVANQVGLAQLDLSRMENGQILPTEEQLQRLAKLYDNDIDELRARARTALTEVYDEVQATSKASDQIVLDDEMMSRLEDVSDLVRGGESEEVAVCASLDDTVFKTLVAIANASGGRIFVGVDGGRPTGVSPDDAEAFVLRGLVEEFDEPIPWPEIRMARIGQIPILEIRIHKSQARPIRMRNGNSWLRAGTDNLPIEDSASTFATVITSASIHDKLQLHYVTSVGSGCRPRRHATASEKCLDIDQQTEAISTFMRSAKGEFCMAVFGRWGRGKTFLLKEVERVLQGDEYGVAWFNAWKYRTTPELWAHLYETIVRSVTQGKSFRKTALAVRAHLVRAGIWCILGYTMVSYCLILPFAAVFQILYVAVSIIGVGFALYLLLVVHKGRQTFSGFQRRFGTLASYQSALGLQAAIGDDLRNVVVGALPNGYFKRRWTGTLLVLVLVLSLAASYGMYCLPGLQECGALPATFVLPTLKTWQVLASVTAWWAIFAYFLLCSVWAIPKCRRMLLVVDDLDRCDPKQMLEIIESIKLLVEDEHLDDRIQVVLLVEESLLRRAVFEKVTSSLSTAQDESPFEMVPAHVLVDEHLDKLFLAYYRLPQLRAEQLTEAADKFIVEQLREIRDELQQELESTTGTERDALQKQLKNYAQLLTSGNAAAAASSAAVRGARDELRVSGADTPAVVKPPATTQSNREMKVQIVIEKLSGLVYSPPEKAVLVSAVNTLAERLGQRHYSCGPRAVRLFLYRYQLVRLLLEASKQDMKWSSEQIVESMILAYEGRVPDANIDWASVDPQLRSIVQSVV